MKHILLIITFLTGIYSSVQNRDINSETLARAAKTLEDPSIVYDPSYVSIPYPGGDVPADTGVCTNVVIRAFRKAFGWDLQESVREYRKAKGKSIDTNIDHRRVRNLMEYFDTLVQGGEMARLSNKGSYLKGNIIIWNLGGGQLHIGICVDNDEIIHNICCGQVIEPMYMEDSVIRNYSLDTP